MVKEQLKFSTVKSRLRPLRFLKLAHKQSFLVVFSSSAGIKAAG